MESLKNEWNNALWKSSDNNIFLTWEWISTWWRHFGEGRKLTVLLAKSGPEILAIAPLMCSEYKTFGVKFKKIEFIGTNQSDYANFILVKKKRKCLSKFMEYLNKRVNDWDLLDLREIPETAECVNLLSGLSKQYPIKRTLSSTCFYIPLPGSYETFMKEARRQTRKDVIRRLRRLKEDYKVQFKTRVDMNSVEDAMETFFSLHQRRWKSRGARGFLANPLIRNFHLETAKCFLNKGWLYMVFLVVDDESVSAKYGFIYNQKFYSYLTGFDPTFAKYSVGSIATLYTIRKCIQNGIREFDFLRGSEPHKKQWTPFSRKNLQITCARTGITRALKIKTIQWLLHRGIA